MTTYAQMSLFGVELNKPRHNNGELEISRLLRQCAEYTVEYETVRFDLSIKDGLIADAFTPDFKVTLLETGEIVYLELTYTNDRAKLARKLRRISTAEELYDVDIILMDKLTLKPLRMMAVPVAGMILRNMIEARLDSRRKITGIPTRLIQLAA